MYFFGNGCVYTRTDKNVKEMLSKIYPYLNHGTIILTSNFQNILALISPTSIKHCSFCYIKDNVKYIVEVNENSKLMVYTPEFFFLKKESVFLFDYYDKEIMYKSMDYFFNYKNFRYGFFGNDNYCYKIVFDIYNDAHDKKFKKMSDFFPVFKFFGLEFVNSHSITNSKRFIFTCSVIKNCFLNNK